MGSGAGDPREYALRLLDLRERTRAELVGRLERRGFDPEVCERVVADLARIGAVDDARFAAVWVESRARSSPAAPPALVAGLRKRGVPRDVAEDAVARAMCGVEEGELALELARGRAARYRGLETGVAARRLGSFLARRGFGPEAVRRAVREALGLDAPG